MKARNAAAATLELAGGYLCDAQADFGCAGLVRWAGDARAASADGVWHADGESGDRSAS